MNLVLTIFVKIELVALIIQQFFFCIVLISIFQKEAPN